MLQTYSLAALTQDHGSEVTPRAQQASLTCAPAHTTVQEEQVGNVLCGPHQTAVHTKTSQGPDGRRAARTATAHQTPRWPQSPTWPVLFCGLCTRVQGSVDSLPENTTGLAALSPRGAEEDGITHFLLPFPLISAFFMSGPGFPALTGTHLEVIDTSHSSTEDVQTLLASLAFHLRFLLCLRQDPV